MVNHSVIIDSKILWVCQCYVSGSPGFNIFLVPASYPRHGQAFLSPLPHHGGIKKTRPLLYTGEGKRKAGDTCPCQALGKTFSDFKRKYHSHQKNNINEYSFSNTQLNTLKANDQTYEEVKGCLLVSRYQHIHFQWSLGWIPPTSPSCQTWPPPSQCVG